MSSRLKRTATDTPFGAFPPGAHSWHWQLLILRLHGNDVEDDLLALQHLAIGQLLLHHQRRQGTDALCEHVKHHHHHDSIKSLAGRELEESISDVLVCVCVCVCVLSLIHI